MVAALYRRYRPESFAELIGQTQVTDPLRTALRTDRVNHAYLFSGPRGCGKTTSARILARCLNCAQGPTDTPCGECASCVELGRGGGGSLDVVEIDAASHNGVDDARDLRERAAFAPARDRYKIFILDEAHMVTPQGFNALLKLVEEPPDHVKFIFATTEPEKVIGTIRSRTHHYPFRLVPPAQMLDYVQELCESEKVEAEPGVLPLVVRGGGGSVRDTLSLLDQLIAGSDGPVIGYERAVALLGYTHGALLDEVIDAFAARDAAAVFAGVDRVIQTGQDPRRFVEDLLERLRDLIVVSATRGDAAAVLRGVPQDQLDRMAAQAAAFGSAELSRAADIANAALTEMTGATSPRLHLELLAARVLVPAADETERGALARVERLERRIGIDDDALAASRDAHPANRPPAEPVDISTRRRPAPTAPPTDAPTTDAPPADAAPADHSAAVADAVAEPAGPSNEPAAANPSTPDEQPPVGDAPAADPPTAPPRAPRQHPTGPITVGQVRDAWPEILEALEATKRSAWMVVFPATVRAYADDVLTLAFPNARDVEGFKAPGGGRESVSELLRGAIHEVLGVRVKFLARVEPGDGPGGAPGAAEDAPPADAAPAAAPPADAPAADPAPADSTPADAPPVDRAPPASGDPAPTEASPAADSRPADSGSGTPDDGSWNVVAIPGSTSTEAPTSPDDSAKKPAKPVSGGRQRYGEAVVREILGASFLEEQSLAPKAPPAPPPDEA